jgi:hypothetical protein
MSDKPAQQEQGQVTVRVRYDTTAVSYASQFLVNATAEELVIAFSPGFVVDPASRDTLLPVQSRIAVTPAGAARLVAALTSALTGLQPPAGGEATLPKLGS